MAGNLDTLPMELSNYAIVISFQIKTTTSVCLVLENLIFFPFNSRFHSRFFDDKFNWHIQARIKPVLQTPDDFICFKNIKRIHGVIKNNHIFHSFPLDCIVSFPLLCMRTFAQNELLCINITCHNHKLYFPHAFYRQFALCVIHALLQEM